MGIDIAKKHVKKRARTEPASKDVYLGLLHKLYAFLERRTDAPFNKVVLKRLRMSNSNRPSLSLSAVARTLTTRPDFAGGALVAVAVATVTDDERMAVVPKMTVAALRFTRSARARILAAGGEAIGLDELAQRAPKGEACVLLRGRKTAREAQRHFGVPGARGSRTAPFVRSEGRKFERARGKR